jgi:Na+-transporting methylmalonyl-CoA/oxaloacetate decarboxylase gamma subunit
MTELLKQALTLTGWGMGMTFMSIGALVLGMYLITSLFRGKSNSQMESEEDATHTEETAYLDENLENTSIENDVTDGMNDQQELAAAAAVAVAMALSQETKAQKRIISNYPMNNDMWNHYVRGRHLSQRSRYEQLKTR